MALLAIATTAWGITSILQNVAQIPAQAILLEKLSILGATSSAGLFLVFILEYTRQDYLLNRRAWLVLWIIPFISVALAFSNEFHFAFWSGYRYDVLTQRFILLPGPLYWIHTIYYYGLRISATIILTWAIVRFPVTYRLQANALLAGAIAIWMGNLLDQLSPFAQLAPWQSGLHPVAYTLSVIIISWGIFRYQLFDVVPIARDIIIENMLYGIIVLDRNEHIVDINMPARYLFRVSEHKNIIGKTFKEAFGHIPEIQEKLSSSDMPFQDIHIPAPVDLYLEVMFTPIFDKQGQIRGKLLSIQDISARMRSEIAMRQSEENLRNVFEGAPFPIAVANPRDGHILYINPAAKKLYDINEKEVRALRAADFYKNQENRTELVELLKQTSQVNNTELQMRTVNDTIIWTTTSLRSIVYNNEEALLITQVDISERKKAEEELQQSRAQLKNIFEYSGAGIHLLDQSGCITFSNQRWAEMLGYEPDELLGKNQSDFILKNDIPYSRHLFESLIIGDIEQYQFEPRFTRKDGSHFWSILSATPIKKENGEIESIVSFVSDITEKKQTENALRETERRFREILENVDFFAVMLDTEGKITFINDNFLLATGWHRPEILGENWFDIFMPNKEADGRQNFSRASERGGIIGKRHENHITTHDKKRLLVAWNSIMLRAENGKVIGTASIGEDITQKRLAEELDKKHREFNQALYDTSVALTSTLNFEEVLDRILDNLDKVVKNDAANISLIKGGVVNFVRAKGYEKQGVPNQAILELHFPLNKVYNLKKVYESKRPLYISDVSKYPSWYPTPSSAWICSHVTSPIIIKDKVVGFIGLDSNIPGFFNNIHAEQLRAFSAQAAIAIENTRLYTKSLHELEERKRTQARLRRANKKLTKQLSEIRTLQTQLREQATRDGLTGLFNRRYLEEVLPKEIGKCQKQKKPLSVIMLDIDFFKSINDTYGHPAGDKILIALGALLIDECGENRIACRYGGEEFAIIVPNTSLETANKMAEKLRILFKSTIVRIDTLALQATISLGVSSLPQHGDYGHALLTAADHALYQAKQDGRNCVRIAKS